MAWRKNKPSSPGSSENRPSPGIFHWFQKAAPRTVARAKSVLTGMWGGLSRYQLGPLWTDWSTENAVRRGLEVSGWVYACIRYIADSASSVTWVVQERNDEGEWVDVPFHPLEALLANPNRWSTGHQFITRLTQHMYVGGNCIVHQLRSVRDEVLELWILNPDRVKPVPHPQEFISSYQFSASGSDPVDISVDDIIHFMFSNPADPYWGLAPLKVIGRVVDTEVEAIRWWKVSLMNRCVKDGILTFKRSLSIAKWREARKELAEQHQGAGGARGPFVVGEDADYKPFTMTPAELDFIQSRKVNRVDICAVFGMPPPLVGDLEHTTYNNVKEARRIFWLDTMIPFISNLQQCLNKSLLPAFEDPLRYRIWYDLSNVEALRENLREKAEVSKILWNMGVPFNKLSSALQLGIKPIPGGDRGYIQSSMLPLDENGMFILNGTPVALPAPAAEAVTAVKGLISQLSPDQVAVYKNNPFLAKLLHTNGGSH